MSEGENTTEDNTSHNKITQQMYDEKASRARKMEGLVADKDAKAKELGFESVEDMTTFLKENNIKKGYNPKPAPTKKDSPDIDAILKTAREEARQPLLDQIKAANERADKTSKELYNVTVGTQSINELKETGLFADDAISVVKDLYLKDSVKQDDNGTLYITDGNGEPTYINGEKKTIADLAKELIEKHPSFKADKSSSNSRPSGGDSSKANTDGGSFDPKAYQAITDRQEKIEYIRKTALSGGKK